MRDKCAQRHAPLHGSGRATDMRRMHWLIAHSCPAKLHVQGSLQQRKCDRHIMVLRGTTRGSCLVCDAQHFGSGRHVDRDR